MHISAVVQWWGSDFHSEHFFTLTRCSLTFSTGLDFSFLAPRSSTPFLPPRQSNTAASALSTPSLALIAPGAHIEHYTSGYESFHTVTLLVFFPCFLRYTTLWKCKCQKRDIHTYSLTHPVHSPEMSHRCKIFSVCECVAPTTVSIWSWDFDLHSSIWNISSTPYIFTVIHNHSVSEVCVGV